MPSSRAADISPVQVAPAGSAGAFIGDRLESFAERTPDTVALKSGALRYTWQELIDRIVAAERQIIAGSPRGGRVALSLDDPAALLIWFFACARTARIAMVLDPAWPEDRRAAVLGATSPDLHIDEPMSLRADPSPAPLSGKNPPDARPSGDDLFYAGFTSGTTGFPKGYVRTHGSWLRSFELADREFGTSSACRVVLPGRLTHSLHLYGAVEGLCRGREVVVAERFDPKALLAELAGADGGSVLYATPTQLHYFAEAARRGLPAGDVRAVFSSGAKWRDKDRAAAASVFPEAQLTEFYGASETSFIAVSLPGEPVPAGSVGRAGAGVDIAIGNPGAPNAPGVAGPLWVRSALLFSGYLCGEAPDTRWQEDWLTVGDCGYLDENGFLFLTGRTGRMIVTAGLNVYPEEIETVLAAHPSVAVAVAVGIEDAVRGQRIEAAVELASSLDDAEDALLRHCRAQLAAGKVPRRVHVRSSLPLTPGGKPDIRAVSADLRAAGRKGGG